MSDSGTAALFLAIMRQVSASAPDDRLLDFGCGACGLVAALRESGVQAEGCDFVDDAEMSDFTSNLQQRFPDGVVKAIEKPYRLPYEDERFQCVISDQVLEHVQDYEIAFAEMHRVLKPGGLAIHIFPSRYRLIEPHALVPLATVIRHKAWLLLWARLGIRNAFQRDLSAQETATRNQRYLTENTYYLTRQQIAAHAHLFSEAAFREDLYLRALENAKGKLARALWKIMPFLPNLISECHTRVLVLRK